MWDVTELTNITVNRDLFLLTHPVWDVTRFSGRTMAKKEISTHTSRVGCDEGNLEVIKKTIEFLLDVYKRQKELFLAASAKQV